MFLSGMGILVSAIFAKFLVLTGWVAIEKSESVQGVLYYKRVLPVGIAYAGTLALGNTNTHTLKLAHTHAYLHACNNTMQLFVTVF